MELGMEFDHFPLFITWVVTMQCLPATVGIVSASPQIDLAFVLNRGVPVTLKIVFEWIECVLW